MGQGGYLFLDNRTKHAWVRIGQGQYQMESWNFPERIPPQSSTQVYIEYSQRIGRTHTDDAAEVVYALEGTGKNFEIRARTYKKHFAPYLEVDTKDLFEDEGATLHSVPPTSGLIHLGWHHDGTVYFRLYGKVSTDTGSKQDANPGSGAPMMSPFEEPGRPATLEDLEKIIACMERDATGSFEMAASGPSRYLNEKALLEAASKETLGESVVLPEPATLSMRDDSRQEEDVYRRWMAKYRGLLKEMTLQELAIPGTHDSATYDMKSLVARPWTQTQRLSIREQLDAGVRALDLRVGLQPGHSDKFIMVHDKWRTNITLEEVLNQVLAFSHAQEREIIILDFHRFVPLDDTVSFQDHIAVANLVATKLGNAIIPPADVNKPLGKIWQTKGRIVVAWNHNESMSGREQLFCSGVEHAWGDKSSTSELFAYLQTEFRKAHTKLWTTCAILTQSATHPIQSIPGELNNWFSAESAWSEKASIVSCDYIDETQLVENLIAANLTKASLR